MGSVRQRLEEVSAYFAVRPFCGCEGLQLRRVGKFSVPDEVSHFFEAARGSQVGHRVATVQERPSPFVYDRDCGRVSDYPREAAFDLGRSFAHISPSDASNAV